MVADTPDIMPPTDYSDFRKTLVLLLPDLRAYARFLVGRSSDADDLVQDAVARALAAAAQWQPNTNQRAWLFAILRNTFYEQARRRRTERVALDRSNLAEAGGAERISAPSQHHQLELDELSRHLFTLSPLLREALVLVGAQGFAYEEAAGICGVPAGTMKARVSRARNLLARAMAERNVGRMHEPVP